MSAKRGYDGFTGLVEAPPSKRGAAAAAASEQHAIWVYEDAAKQEQGPFALSAMQAWFKQGFLPLETRVRRTVDVEFFLLRQCQEIAGCDKAEPRTAEQWKATGNSHMAAARLSEAIAAYGSALECCSESEATLRGALLSNRSGAHLLQEDADAALADARLCVAARPGWGKAHWRLAVSLLLVVKRATSKERVEAAGWRQLCDALDAADRAEKLDPVAAHTETKHAALELLQADAVRVGLEAAGGMEQQLEERSALLRRFRTAQDDTDLRLRCKRVAEQEARDAEAVARGSDDAGAAWGQKNSKESAAEYTARRERIALLEKIDRAAAAANPNGSSGGGGSAIARGGDDDDDERAELERQAEIVDEQLAYSQRHATILRR
jgi:hypothetical protein